MTTFCYTSKGAGLHTSPHLGIHDTGISCQYACSDSARHCHQQQLTTSQRTAHTQVSACCDDLQYSIAGACRGRTALNTPAASSHMQSFSHVHVTHNSCHQLFENKQSLNCCFLSVAWLLPANTTTALPATASRTCNLLPDGETKQSLQPLLFRFHTQRCRSCVHDASHSCCKQRRCKTQSSSRTATEHAHPEQHLTPAQLNLRTRCVGPAPALSTPSHTRMHTGCKTTKQPSPIVCWHRQHPVNPASRIAAAAYTFCREPKMFEPTNAATAAAPRLPAPTTCAATSAGVSSGTANTRAAAPAAASRPRVLSRPGVPLLQQQQQQQQQQ
jgi:hypothetical protein